MANIPEKKEKNHLNNGQSPQEFPLNGGGGGEGTKGQGGLVTLTRNNRQM